MQLSGKFNELFNDVIHYTIQLNFDEAKGKNLGKIHVKILNF